MHNTQTILFPFEYDTDYKILLYCLHRLYSVVSVILKEGLTGPHHANLSLGMTMTKTLRSVFSWSASYIVIRVVSVYGFGQIVYR